MFDALKHPLLMLALAIDQNYGFYPVSHHGSVEFFKVFRGARREMWRTPGAAPSKHRNRSVFNDSSNYANFQHLHRKLLWSAAIVSAVGWALSATTQQISTPPQSAGPRLGTILSLLVFWTRPVTNKTFGPIVTLSQGSICPGKMRVSLWGFHRN